MLARLLRAYEGRKDAVVLAIPRGGVAVGRALADELKLPLDVLFTKKIGHPLEPEFAVGVASLDGDWIDEDVVERDLIPRSYLKREAERLRGLLRERDKLYRGGRPPTALKGKAVVLVDDGAATGDTMSAAVRLAKARGAASVAVALPVAPPETARKLRGLADELYCILTPGDFFAIGQFYDDFAQLEDEEAIRLLRPAGEPTERKGPSARTGR